MIPYMAWKNQIPIGSADAEFDYMANAKEQCKRGYFDMYCYECACSPH